MASFRIQKRLLTVWVSAFILGLVACEPPQDAQEQAQLTAKLAEEQATRDAFNDRVQALQMQSLQASDNQTLAQQLALLPQPAMQKILVGQPDTSMGAIAVDSSSQAPTIVENAAMLMAVREYEESRAKVLELATQYDAMISAESEKFTELRIENTLTIQTPVANFKKMVEELRNLAMVLREKRIWREDLTVSWTEVQARLEAKRIAQKRLQEMLRQASKSTDVLPIQRELELLQEDMQTLQRTAQTIRQKSLFSTITLTIYQEVAKPSAATASFSDRMGDNFNNGWANFKLTLIQAAAYWVYIILGAMVLFVMWLAARNSRKQAQKQQQQLWQAQQQWISQVKKPIDN